MSETATRAGVREWVGLVVLALPALVIALDFTGLHLAVPHLSADLQPTSTQMLWIVDIYGFMIAGLLITMGTVGDRIGRRRLLLAGGAAFGAASVLAALSTSAPMLIAARALLGVTGATLLPSTLSLISTMFADATQRRLAIAVWSSSFMAGGAIGPLVGGALLEAYWWGAVFLPAVPVMALLVVLGPIVLPEFRSDSAGRADLISVVLAMAAILPVVYGIKELAQDGPAVLPLVTLVAGLLLGWAFVRRQRRLAHPLLDLALFTRRGFTVSLGAQVTALFVLAAVQFFLMQYLQLVLGLSPLRAGLWTVPAMAAGVAGTLLVPVVTRRVPPVRVITAGFALAVVGMLLVVVGSPGLGLTITGFVVLNLALNPAMVLTYDLIINSAPSERVGTASGTAETGNELGIALGVAITGSIGAAVYRARVSADVLPADTPPAVADAARDTLGGAVAAAGELPAGVGEPLLAVTREAFLAGMQWASVALTVLLVGVTVAAAALLRGTGTGTGSAAPAAPAAEEEGDLVAQGREG
ncbi:MFS transporter, DHA2 family, multidrug resistance protein [Amycolatopsis arida]|uniref:MFS transporter, DHA2 family, multidrug resistance protein n=1 Tax=Amycolatopsis arida TaxID=587909 RepID=A0A1I5LDD1_9PSEU|nr:MFS transporter [Amycolatopsis arida]TDX93683.1 DHA2 family multidrug resistance protein-like MFS transporter [Amycolatopsis arida]SFO95384.1 MFS transporter, DHA2 family, multidrug resistance protein [Amycolatopsis arida]